MVEITKKVYATAPAEWRQWLADNYNSATEAWLVTPRKHTGKPSMSYNDSVEQALCFGWIDSIRKKLDDDHLAQRFSPRRDLNNFSQTNIERLRYLAKQGQLMLFVEKQVKPMLEKKFHFPKDIIDALKATPEAYKNFKSFSPTYQRIRVAYVDDARERPGEFKKRLKNLVAKSAANKQIGYGGIDKYF